MKFDAETEKGKAAIALKLHAGMIASALGEHITCNEAAEVLASLVGDLIAASAGSSAIQLGYLISKMQDEVQAQARKAFEVMGELGIN